MQTQHWSPAESSKLGCVLSLLVEVIRVFQMIIHIKSCFEIKSWVSTRSTLIFSTRKCPSFFSSLIASCCYSQGSWSSWQGPWGSTLKGTSFGSGGGEGGDPGKVKNQVFFLTFGDSSLLWLSLYRQKLKSWISGFEFSSPSSKRYLISLLYEKGSTEETKGKPWRCAFQFKLDSALRINKELFLKGGGNKEKTREGGLDPVSKVPIWRYPW